MVDSEGPPPHSAAAPPGKLSHHHFGMVGCCFVLRIVLCLLCFALRSSSLFAFHQLQLTWCSFFLSFFLSFFDLISLVVGCRLLFPPYWYSSLVPTPIPRRHWPRGCSHCSSAASASHSLAVLLLGSSASMLLLGANPRPFFGGIGGAPARFLGGALGAPHWPFLGGAPHWPRLGVPRLGGAPHETSVVSAGAPPRFLVLQCCSA
jgi:hypothetical protein